MFFLIDRDRGLRCDSQPAIRMTTLARLGIGGRPWHGPFA
jgi:hypothetical protein